MQNVLYSCKTFVRKSTYTTLEVSLFEFNPYLSLKTVVDSLSLNRAFRLTEVPLLGGFSIIQNMKIILPCPRVIETYLILYSFTSDSVYVETQLLNTTNVEKIIIPEFIVSQKLDENIS